jgi:hypothetical protein
MVRSLIRHTCGSRIRYQAATRPYQNLSIMRNGRTKDGETSASRPRHRRSKPARSRALDRLGGLIKIYYRAAA